MVPGQDNPDEARGDKIIYKQASVNADQPCLD